MPAKGVDDNSRRTYWSNQMDKAYDFMMQIVDYPVEECGEPLVPLASAASAAGIDVAFCNTKASDGSERLFYLREGLIKDFLAVARDMNNRGWILKVEDSFRTPQVQEMLARTPQVFDATLRTILWECNGKTPDVDFVFRRISAMIAFCPKVGTHTSASAIDVSVLSRETAKEINRGGHYPEFSEVTPMESPFTTKQARQNRAEITAIMRRHGFVAYPYEFWHYSKGDAYDEMLNRTGQAARYGPINWDSKLGRVSPIEHPAKRLNSDEKVKREIDRALLRIGQQRVTDI